VDNTERKAAVSLDWLMLVIPGSVATAAVTIEQQLDMWALPTQDFEDTGKGFLGWEHRYNLECGGVIGFGGQSGSSVISLSSTALTSLVSVFDVDLLRWCSYLLELGAKCRRFDVALDDFTGLVTYDRIISACKSGDLITKAQGLPRVDGTKALGGEDWTIYIGQRVSETFTRIYNKAAERKVSGSWVRFETEFKGEKAEFTFREWVNSGLDSSKACAIIRGVVDFRSGPGENKTRWNMLSWWSKFLGVVGVCRVKVSGVVRTIAQVEDWLINQVSASLSLLRTLKGSSRVQSLIDVGDRRQGARQNAIARASFALGVV